VVQYPAIQLAESNYPDDEYIPEIRWVTGIERHPLPIVKVEAYAGFGWIERLLRIVTMRDQ
jgi:hypothetical protein